ncbi:hypothetical protein WJX72_009831 [[Myrmecia] bisecta]|uniref:Uncharacterized protein n=1 Tax=[Myrmecia] bisecta TaxID=41462 RepID=A0AAW1Q2G6_9CHLO
MKFGKRLSSEAARRWKPFYFDYKNVKRAISADVQSKDARGRNFDIVVRHELHKVSAFTVDKEEELEAVMDSGAELSPRALAQYRAELTELRKYCVLNYIAVIKAVKKRNRHLREACGAARVETLKAEVLLSHQYFFTSPKLASLLAKAEVLANESLASAPAADLMLREYQCPICLDVLHNVVLLTCAHRFCWGCLVAHCATVQRKRHATEFAAGEKPVKAVHEHYQAVADTVSENSDASAVDTYDCPVCRRAQLLDLDRLKVDPHLSKYIADLQHQNAGARTTSTATVMEVTLSTDHLKQEATAAAVELELSSESRLDAEREGESSIDEECTSAAVPCPFSHRDRPPCGSLPSQGLLERAAVTPPQPLAKLRAVTPERRVSPERPAPCVQVVPLVAEEPPLLPPQTPDKQGKMTCVLDLDGTLTASFTPARAPRLPAGTASWLVGRGSTINPGGVCVVERPALGQFLRQLAQFTEVVLFTAGMEEYARPIVETLERKYGKFAAVLYRPATTPGFNYPCIKDLARLGRSLATTIIVDDTPLAFAKQPDNGIPILAFRADDYGMDDHVLVEAILPLLQSLSAARDVRPVLRKRFNMPKWFTAQGVPVVGYSEVVTASASSVKRRLQLSARVESLRKSNSFPSSTELLQFKAARGCDLLLCDFDCSLTNQDAGERLFGELAPELKPLLDAVQMPANFIPVTNTILAEMQRRGVTRDEILAQLKEMGREIPMASVEMLQWAFRQRVDVRILSDCNSVFINHMLAGAKVNALVKEVITNLASFERTETPALLPTHQRRPASQRLRIRPRHNYLQGSHSCPLCPENLCKGQELEALRSRAPYKRIVYVGDGANDLCPSLALTTTDVVLVRKGYALEKLILAREGGPEAVEATVRTWTDHAQLFAMVQDVLA